MSSDSFFKVEIVKDEENKTMQVTTYCDGSLLDEQQAIGLIMSGFVFKILKYLRASEKGPAVLGRLAATALLEMQRECFESVCNWLLLPLNEQDQLVFAQHFTKEMASLLQGCTDLLHDLEAQTTRPQ